MIKFKYKVLIFITLIILVVLWQLNWFSPNKSWQEATGWDQIPASQKVEFYNPKLGDPKISWLGHAGFLIEWEGQRIAFDPNLSSHCNISRRTFAAPINPVELGKLDAVIISHAHYDHLDLPTLNNIQNIEKIILPKNSQNFFPDTLKNKFEINDLNIGETIVLGKLKITAVPAIHNGSRFHPFKSKYFALGYIITNNERTLYLSGDTAYSSHFKEIAKTYHPNIAILPIGAFRPQFVLQKYHLSPKEAVQAALDLKVQTLIPGHFGTFRLSLDYPETALPEFALLAQEAKIHWEMGNLLSNTGY